MKKRIIFENMGLLLGRACLATIFLIAGFTKLTQFPETISHMSSAGILYTEIFLVLAIVTEIGGGLMILFGWKARLGALIILVFVASVTYVFHPFWAVDQAEIANQSQHFLKNLSIIGGMLYIMCSGPGRYSFDRWER